MDIAIIGVACRFPDAPNPAAFWRLLRDGTDAVTDAPPDRRADNCLYDPGSGAHRGGFLDRIDEFDADFFGVSPREAEAMDPQQRLMLELIWEVAEDARVAPDSLRASRTGVFVGAMADDYATLVHQRPLEAVTRHTMTGLQRSFIANRVSYSLGLRGPSLTVDTGQSSSLVAVHLACSSLRRAECTAAVAGGVHLNIAAHGTMQAIKLGVLSPDGICAALDEHAAGFVRGEGAGVVLLKPLNRALADGDRVYCVIRGSAVGNDGGTPANLTAPGQVAQGEVLEAAYRDAGIQPSAVQYVELHGTGTKAGDPAEVAALAATCGTGRAPESPLLVGSVKTNIGHLEGAAGIAGLIKTALCLAHRELVPSLHFRAPNPRIPLAELRIRLQQETRPWPAGEEPALAGVSSFGMGGTNCHVVLAGLAELAGPAVPTGHAARPRGGVPETAPLPWVFSGRSEDALRAQAAQLLGYADGDLRDVAYSLATTRTTFEHRAAVIAADSSGLRAGLRAVAEGLPAANVLRGPVDGTAAPGRLAFLFPGQGFQRSGMGRRLASAFPAFADAFDAACAEFRGHLDRPLQEVVWAAEGTEAAALLDQTRYTQPALFATEVALYRLIESFGLHPDVVLGHSVGEFAAAHAAGVLSLADAAKLVAVRGELMQGLPPGGAMIAVQAAPDEVVPLLAGKQDRVAIAAINGPAAVVISGEASVAEQVAADIASKGRKTRRLKVSHAFHSPLMEPVLAELRTVADGLSFRRPRRVEFISTVTGRPATVAELRKPGYWAAHARNPVRFADAVAALEAGGTRLCLETGPGNGLAAMGKVALAGKGALFVTSMHGKDEVAAVTAAVAALHVRGVPADWRTLAGPGVRRVDLPTYPFQRQRYWLRSAAEPEAVPAAAATPAAPPPRPAAGDVRALVLEIVAAVLGHDDPGRIEVTRPFKDLGFDSGMTVELAARLSDVLGRQLEPSLIYSCPAPHALIEHLRAAPSEPTGPPSPATAGAEPIAIIAMSCRYPGGVRSPEDLWALVDEGKDAISDFPVNRGWDLAGLYDPEPGRAGRTYSTRGGFLHDADEFDAAFFGISPREATAMDPQQRVLLETCWEAVERAALPPGSLRGEQVGVFVGATAQDYGPRLHEPCDGFEGHLLTGNTPSVISGRIAYALGLRGPALTIDTACSSSLVALHLAGQALRAGDCRLALACGVTVMASPGMFVNFSMQRGLAEDGRCKAFAAAADGTSWAEGAGVVVLERLADARRLGHPVLALIRGSATNQDGASNGLTAPNGNSQELVIRAALARAGLTSRDVDAVEAHGTGTALGDPVEAAALIATYGQRREPPLLVGSLKSNIGHSQAAAGIGGVIKMVSAIRHGTLPRTLHVDKPSPHVDWSAGTVSLLTEPRPWPAVDRPRRAAVSSLGISGTNAHIILEQEVEQAPEAPAPPPPAPSGGVLPWVLSAASPAALRAQAERLLGSAAARDEDCADVGYSLGTTRSHLTHRAAILAADRDEFRTALAALAAGEPGPGIIQGTAGTGPTAFIFPGQGSQWPGMALELLESSEVFRDRIADCAKALKPYTDWSLWAVLRGDQDAPPPSRVDVVQPALFAVMVSLAAVWQSAGVTPDAVAGHSQGEIAAACVAGALSLDDAAKVVALRSRALGDLAGTGMMASVPLPAADVRELLARRAGSASGVGGADGLLEVASVNGSQSTTIAGPPGAVRDFVGECRARDINARAVDVDYASHSSHVEVLKDTLIETLDGIAPRTSDIPFFSTVTGEPIDTARLDAGYWYRNLRSPVQLEAATRAMLRAGHQTLIEVSPHPILTVPITQTAEDAKQTATVTGTLRRDQGGPDQFLTAVAQAYVAGAPVCWEAIFPGRRRVPLPVYPFQHQRFWLAASGGADQSLAMAGLEPAAHPLLGALTELPDDAGLLLTGRVSLATHPWLSGHRVRGVAVMSATTLLDLAGYAGDQVGCAQVAELTMQAPVVVPEQGFVRLRVMAEPSDDPGRWSLAIYSRPERAPEEPADQPWTRHATGTLAAAGRDVAPPAFAPSAWPPRGAAPVDLSGVYPGLERRGYCYGPGFRGLRAAWQRDGEVFADVTLPDPEPPAAEFMLHPVLLDSALHALLRLWTDSADGLQLPFSWTGVTVHAAGASRLRVRLAPDLSPDGAASVSMTATGPNGQLVARVDGLAFRPVADGALNGALAGPGSSLLRLEWCEKTVCAAPSPCRYAVIGEADSALPGSRYPDLASLGRALDGGAEPPDLVFAVCQPPPADADVPGAIQLVARRTLELVSSWLADERFGPARLVLVTRGAIDGATAPTQAPAWGLVRSAQSENPGRFVLADVAPGEFGSLPAAAAAGEPQLALRDGKVLVPRLRDHSASDQLTAPAGTPAWRLDPRGAGGVDALTLVPCPSATAPLGPGYVRIAVRAAGLNFRDVAITLGLLPSGQPIGIEGAGVVTEVGPGVAGLAPGDRVMGLFDWAFGPVAVADHRALAPIPDGWSFAAAAAVPVTFITAYQCLADIAGLRPGETVVVHAGTGGVGLAAIGVARYLGAEVFATASPGKWHVLRAMGLDDAHIASSRSLEFAARFRAATGGRGVDVVLNALAGEFTDASLRLLTPGGRFVEMGMTDVRDSVQVGAAYSDVSYHRYNLRAEPPGEAGRALRRVLELFERGVFQHPPVTSYDVRAAREAFTLMSRAQHVGKLVLTVPRPLDPNGTVFITGGTGTLAGLLARHLVTAHGIRHIVLAGRRGAAASGAAELAASLGTRGAQVDLVACDVADRDSLRQALAGIPGDHPLTAVVHAAGMLDDALVPDLTAERLASVLRPKSDGAWHLHELTQHLDIAAFVLFSSVIGVLGEAGQANYAAANSVLDAVARHRRARGLPATSLDWGIWAERSGMTGHLADADLARLRRGGMAPLPTGDALRLFDAALGATDPVLVPVCLDRAALAARDDVPALLSELVTPSSRPARVRTRRASAAPESNGNGHGNGHGGRPAPERLAGLTAAERDEVLLRIVCAEAATVLGLAGTTLAPGRAFRELGLDSLTGLELRNRLSTSTGLRLRACVTADYPTPSALAAFLGGELNNGHQEN